MNLPDRLIKYTISKLVHSGYKNEHILAKKLEGGNRWLPVLKLCDYDWL